MKINYSKLRGKVVEHYGTIYNFSKASGYSRATISNKLNGTRPFTHVDMTKWIELLNLSNEEIIPIFFER